MSEKTVVQKLLIKEGYRVLVVNAPQGYVASLAELPAGVIVATGLDDPGPFDVIQTFVASQAEFEAQLGGLKALLKPKGCCGSPTRKAPPRSSRTSRATRSGAMPRQSASKGSRWSRWMTPGRPCG